MGFYSEENCQTEAHGPLLDWASGRKAPVMYPLVPIQLTECSLVNLKAKSFALGAWYSHRELANSGASPLGFKETLW